MAQENKVSKNLSQLQRYAFFKNLFYSIIIFKLSNLFVFFSFSYLSFLHFLFLRNNLFLLQSQQMFLYKIPYKCL